MNRTAEQQEADRILAAWDCKALAFIRQGIARASVHTHAERRLCAGPWASEPAREVCPDCYGSREVIRADGAPTVCGECSGRGYVEVER